jgi:hypothetical protein
MWMCVCVCVCVCVQGILKGGKYHCTIDLLFDWLGISCMTTDNFCVYLQNRLIQTNQTGGQWYSDTSPLVFPGACFKVYDMFFFQCEKPSGVC